MAIIRGSNLRYFWKQGDIKAYFPCEQKKRSFGGISGIDPNRGMGKEARFGRIFLHMTDELRKILYLPGPGYEKYYSFKKSTAECGLILLLLKKKFKDTLHRD